MDKRLYQFQEIKNVIEELQNQQVSGTLKIKAHIDLSSTPKDYVCVINKGVLIYCNRKIPDNQEFLRRLVQKFKPTMVDSSIKFVIEKVSNKGSIQELLTILVKLRVLTWEEIKSFIEQKSIFILESLLPDTVELEVEPDILWDLNFAPDYHSLDWSKIEESINQREQQWKALRPIISSSASVPHISTSNLEQISDPNVCQHLLKWANGKNSLMDIAENINQDPLSIAYSYFKWAQLNWVHFNDTSNNIKADKQSASSSSTILQSQDLATILSVDDSPVMQVSIKKAIGSDYNLIFANNAVDALNILNQKHINLILLDVTMPDIDGLEMCRTLRRIPKFHDLPIIMVTGRDTLIDKMKGQIAGTNCYLTKPFDREKLLSVIQKFIGEKTFRD